MTTSIGHEPDGRWKFDENVTRCFDDMLRRSIPDLIGMRTLVAAIAKKFAPEGEEEVRVLDLGTSRGGALKAVRDVLPRARLIGVEVSPPMLDAARQHFKGDELATIRELDLRTDYPSGPFDITMAILTLQFTPIEYRLEILRRAFEETKSGGALIVVEKVIGGSAYLDRRMTDIYYDGKSAMGYPREEIERKRLALEGILVPLTASMNQELLSLSGFREIDCFWRWMNFAGWIAVKS